MDPVFRFLWFVLLTLSLMLVLAKLLAEPRSAVPDDPPDAPLIGTHKPRSQDQGMEKSLLAAVFIVAVTVARALLY